MAMLSSVIGFFFMIIPVVVLAFVFRWIRFFICKLRRTNKAKSANHFVVIGYKEAK
ncbi:hypothetical protein [Bacillus sp. S14(2024)]|uniref:hypothetical protein n=1 Tax=Bacillus sp. S14(2024) TaxID=3162884 RepID=UPI003D1A7DA4